MIYFDGILYSWQKGGGVYRYFKKLEESLKNRGVEYTVVLPEPHLKPGPHSFIVRKVFSFLHKIKLESFFKKISKGIFHSTYFTTYKNLKIKQILTVHDMTYEKFPEMFSDSGSKRFIKNKKVCIDKADAIICVSEHTKNCLKEIYKTPEEKIHVIHHGVDDYFNSDYDKRLAGHLKSENALEKPFLLFVGNRGKYKNFELFIKSFSAWGKNPAYDIVIVGGGPITPVESNLIKEAGIVKQIKVLGYVNEDELKTLYCLSKAFVFPSLDEGFGLPILEAICCGTRVLASDIGPFKEIGKDIPLFFNPKDKASLMSAFEILISLPAMTPDEKARNAQKIRESFSWEKSLDAHTALYKTYLE